MSMLPFVGKSAPLSRHKLLGLGFLALVACGMPTLRGEAPPEETDDSAQKGKIVFRSAWLDGAERHAGLYIANPDGTKPELVSDLPQTDRSRLSSNRKMLLFLQGGELVDYVITNQHLSLLNLTDKSRIDLETGTWGFCWSSDSSKVFFAVWPAGESTDIVSINSDGNGRRNVVRLPYRALLLDVSPHTEGFLIMRGDGRRAELYRVGADGEHLVQLTDNQAWDGRGRFSPDGKSILFTSTRSGSEQVHVMDADGREVKQLSNLMKGQVSGCTWSPDGKQIAYAWLPLLDNLRSPAVIYIAGADGSNPAEFRPDGALVGENHFYEWPDWR